MFHKILVCSDGSDCALAAARGGARVLARGMERMQVLFRVFTEQAAKEEKT